MFMRSSQNNEFWSALMEKAYAKLHGSYEALESGSTCEALIDFTGGVTEMYDLKNPPANFFNILVKAFERNSMMGCSIRGNLNEKEGRTKQCLIRDHAYSVTKAALVDITLPIVSGKIPLMRLRNPWGNEHEWSGAFSDKSRDWDYISEMAKRDIDLNFDHDGEFWMSFRDFMNNFDLMEICNLSPDDLTKDLRTGSRKKWNMKDFEGQWVAGVSAGGCANYDKSFYSNPQYVMRIAEPDEGDKDGLGTVVVGLMQKNNRLKRNIGHTRAFFSIGYAIYLVTKQDFYNRPQKSDFFNTRLPVAMTPVFNNFREVSYRFKLPPAYYLIVPSTFKPDQEGEFLIRIFSEGHSTFVENDEPIDMRSYNDRVRIFLTKLYF